MSERVARAIKKALIPTIFVISSNLTHRRKIQPCYCDRLGRLDGISVETNSPKLDLVGPQQTILPCYKNSIFHSVVFYFRLLIRALYISLCITPSLLASPLFILGTPALSEAWCRLLKSSIVMAGPCCIKLSQWIATRPDLFPLRICLALEGLQANARKQTKSEVLKNLKSAFGENWRSVVKIDEADIHVLGSGCVAQVVEGSYGSTKVAIKMLHPGMRELFIIDLTILRALALTISRVPGASCLSLVEVVDEFSDLMLAQLDLRREASSLDRMRMNFGSRSWSCLHFPRVLVASESILIESFEDGTLMSSYLQNSASGKQSRAMAALGLDMFLKMVFIDNFVHGDLHPGNIIVKTKGGHFLMSVIDAGITVELRPEDRRNFLDLFRAIVFNEGREVGRLMWVRSRGSVCIDKDGFERGVEEIISEVHENGLRLGRISVGLLLQKILMLCYRHQVKLESRFANLLLAIGVLGMFNGTIADRHLSFD
jgi:aarF domain-containing kinase